jgi:hypothetical protein
MSHDNPGKRTRADVLAADILLVNGRVWTGRDCPVGAGAPSAVGVTGTKIAAVGTDTELSRMRAAHTHVVDLAGRRVIPGLIDSHIHAIRAGLTYLDELDWTEVYGLSAAVDSVRAAAAQRPPGTWITAPGGWHPAQFADEQRLPTLAELDAAAPAHPVFVHAVYAHDDWAVLNTAALQALGWCGHCPNPEGGTLPRRPDGAPDGRLVGLDAYQHVVRLALRPTADRAVASTRAYFTRLAALGLTGVIDAGGLGMSADKYDPVRAAWRAGELPIRVRMNVGAATRGREGAEIAEWRQNLVPGSGDDLLSVTGVGEVLHFGCHDWEGMLPFEIGEAAYRELVEIMVQVARGRWPLTIHAILDSSVRRILDAIEEVAAEVPLDGLRWSLCHVECASAASLQRVADLGLAVAVQSRIAHKMATCAERWGEETAQAAPRLGDLVRLGIPFGAGTDSTRGASYNPWRALSWFVTGRPHDGGPRRDAEHRLQRATALHAYTAGSAWLSFEEDRRGALRPGFEADLAVLSEDFFEVDESRIPFITSDLTVVAGRVVHAGAPFAGTRLDQHPRRPAPNEGS